jgi:hypothetical protein
MDRVTIFGEVGVETTCKESTSGELGAEHVGSIDGAEPTGSTGSAESCGFCRRSRWVLQEEQDLRVL